MCHRLTASHREPNLFLHFPATASTGSSCVNMPANGATCDIFVIRNSLPSYKNVPVDFFWMSCERDLSGRLKARDLLEYVRRVVVSAVRASPLIAWSALINMNRARYFLFIFIVDIQMVPRKFSSAHTPDKALNTLSISIHCVSQPTQSHGRIIPAFFYDELLHCN